VPDGIGRLTRQGPLPAKPGRVRRRRRRLLARSGAFLRVASRSSAGGRQSLEARAARQFGATHTVLAGGEAGRMRVRSTRSCSLPTASSDFAIEVSARQCHAAGLSAVRRGGHAVVVVMPTWRKARIDALVNRASNSGTWGGDMFRTRFSARYQRLVAAGRLRLERSGQVVRAGRGSTGPSKNWNEGR